ncbi:hypothetical protein OEA41_006142 [Lepraria neglecta]|uniref:Uncharacterized protein n=1 Tax=Lepraria neglecta TaxID=209136 RepID=A0AAD9Z9S7_9LECA|nr:hypothetical protein OEA41_006142 [Lepraria neglecta]
MTKKIAPEGLVPFDVPAANKSCRTWYRIIGDLKSPSTPLITLHGGPGACHEYLLPLKDLNDKHGVHQNRNVGSLSPGSMAARILLGNSSP